MKKIYLAIAYSGMENSSFNQVNKAAVAILKRGHNVFSPITHSHILHRIDDGIGGDWAFWSQIDYQYLDWADEVWVLIPKEGMDRIKASTGVQAEIKYAEEQGMKVKYCQMKDGKLEYYQTTIFDK